MIEQLASVSLSCSVVILLLLFLRPLLCRRYRAELRYWIWLALAVRLLVPLSPSWPASPVALPSLPETAVSFSVPLSGGETAVPAGGEVLTPAVPSLSVSGLLTAVWAAGAVVFLAWHLLAAFFFRRKAVRWSTMFQNGRPDVLMCKCAPSPMLIGLLHPVILLPDGAYSQEDLDMILAHETVHYRRGYLWAKLLLLLCVSVHWFNPLVHLMARAADRDLELSCDERVVRGRDGAFRKTYLTSILHTFSAHAGGALSTSFRGGKKEMKERFSNILQTSKKRRGVPVLLAAVLLTAASGLLVSYGQSSQNGKFSASSLIAEMGEDKTGAVEALGFDMSQAQLQEMGAEQEYSVSAEIDGAPCTVTLSFYNDIFMGFRYVFSDRETAFACAAQVRGALGEAYGEKTSMPGLSSAQETPGSLSYHRLLNGPSPDTGADCGSSSGIPASRRRR